MKFFRTAALLLIVVAGAGHAQALTLDEAIALGRNRSLRMQDPRIDRERINGQVTEAWSNALPQIDGLASYQRTWKSPVLFIPIAPEPLKIQPDNSAIGQVTLSQPIYTFRPHRRRPARRLLGQALE